MVRSKFMFATLVVFLFSLGLSGVEASPSRTRMRDIETLLFMPGKMTEVHRGPPVPQMECVGGSGSKHAEKVRAIACKNAGWDGTQVIWKCETELPDGLEIGDFTVICEGWQKGDTEWIATGTCGIEYNLIQTAPQAKAQNVQPTAVPCTEDDSCTMESSCIDGTCTMSPEQAKRALNEELKQKMKNVPPKTWKETAAEIKKQRDQRAIESAIITFTVFMAIVIPLLLLTVITIINSHNAPLVTRPMCRLHGWNCDRGCDCIVNVECRDHWLAQRMFWARQPYYDPHCYTPFNGYQPSRSGYNLRSRSNWSENTQQEPEPTPQTRRQGEDDVSYNERNSETHMSHGFGGSRTRDASNEEGSVSDVQITPQQTTSTPRKSSGFGGSSVRERTTSWEKPKAEEKKSDDSWGWTDIFSGSGSGSSGFGGSSTRSSSSSSSSFFGGSSGTSKSSGSGGSRTR